ASTTPPPFMSSAAARIWWPHGSKTAPTRSLHSAWFVGPPMSRSAPARSTSPRKHFKLISRDSRSQRHPDCRQSLQPEEIAMQIAPPLPATVPRPALWLGYVTSALVVLAMLASGPGKLMKPPDAVKMMADLGWDEGFLLPLAICEIT